MSGPLDFTNENIENTYQRVLQTDGINVYDGTGSLFTLPSANTASLLTTASATGNTITFTKGDGSTFPIIVDTGSASFIDTGSFVTTSSFNSFTSSYNTGSFTGSFTGELIGTASWAYSASQAISSSYVLSASYAESSSYSLSSSQAISASYTLSSSYAESSSYSLSSSYTLSSSFASTASYVNPLYQQVLISGSLKLDPSEDPDPSGTDLDSTVLFQSASNTSLGYDLYIRQDGNLVKWKWVEGVMNTGLLYGGVVTYSGTDVYVSSGSGIIVEHNAITGSEISPIVTYVTWNDITQSIANIATQQVTYLYIDENGNLQQQSSRFTPQQYHSYLPLGAVGHFDYTQISAFGGQVQTAYDQISQISTFIDAFGPLKTSGYGITGQAGSLRFSIESGTSFIHGGFYENDPEFPSIITTPAQATASIAYVFRSGSGVRFDTNGGTLYDEVRPGWYDPGTGNTGSVSNNDWTIQRVFSDPKTGIAYVYYGQKIYPDFNTALADLSTDPFTEGDTFDFTTFIGFLVLKSNGTDITAANNRIVPAGLFRGGSAGAGGGGGAESLDDLSDVSITTPIDGEALVYNSGVWINGNPASSSYALSSSYSLSSSYAESSSYSLSSSYALTASYIDGGFY